ncbi:hypothetical protein GRAN_4141 [Granulicella sibirica]|uniref:Uncharacterized protein n=1 Tax=Granulicella sibirica TaxID=2479048 RepID=A0A4Q0SW70_9BACT|nr:hypothetical protein GRAN_4141 [Granulicella sibirica]
MRAIWMHAPAESGRIFDDIRPMEAEIENVRAEAQTSAPDVG